MGDSLTEENNGNNNKKKIFICPICGEETEDSNGENGSGNGNGNRQRTRHHPLKKAVWGSNDYTIKVCSKCHPRLESNVSRMEAIILKLFAKSYAEVNALFQSSGGRDFSDAELEKICFDGFLRLKKLDRKVLMIKLRNKLVPIDAMKNMINQILGR
ncbi:MAG: hypothetical protein PHG23_00180 [Candidatus Pacebacteria bacterium]|nr:hypothetical protein [Candidatus Paceibacterota bacterium]